MLAGPGAVTLADDEVVAMPDLGANFFLEEGDVGKPRARYAKSQGFCHFILLSFYIFFSSFSVLFLFLQVTPPLEKIGTQELRACQEES